MGVMQLSAIRTPVPPTTSAEALMRPLVVVPVVAAVLASEVAAVADTPVSVTTVTPRALPGMLHLFPTIETWLTHSQRL